MTQKKHNRLTEEYPEATVHLDEIQAMLDAGIPVYIELNAEIQAMLDADMKTTEGGLIKLTRDSITDILGIPMIETPGYLWSTDTYRAIIPVEDVDNSSGCSKCIFDKYDCHYIDCFNAYYEYRQVITDEDCAPRRACVLK